MTPNASYDEAKAARYWGIDRFDGGVSEEEAVLGLARSPGVNEAYAAWELGVIRRFLPSALSSIVDIGCGVGRISEELAAGVVVSIDRAHGMTERCVRRLRPIRVPLVAQGSAASLPLRTGALDAAICLGVLEHLPQPVREQVLMEIARVVTPGGTAMVEVNNALSARLRDPSDNSFRREVQLANGYFCGLMHPVEIANRLEDAGLKIQVTCANPRYSMARLGAGGRTANAEELLACVDADLGDKRSGVAVDEESDQFIFVATRLR